MNKDISGLANHNNGLIFQEIVSNHDKIDKHIGNKLKDRRNELGYSSSAIAKKINIPVKQLQKYESGLEGICASHLLLIANAIGVKVSYFFAEFEESICDYQSNVQEMHYETKDIVNDKLRSAILGIINIAKKMPRKP
jgi:transcriptional regulator with XRE-family HTH domain